MPLYAGDYGFDTSGQLPAGSNYWIGSLGPTDDFGDIYDTVMIDGKTKMGPCANMTQRSWARYGIGRFGAGFGQRYEKQPDGRWLKVEG